MGAPLADGADLAGAEGVTLPEHVRRNRAEWTRWAPEYAEWAPRAMQERFALGFPLVEASAESVPLADAGFDLRPGRGGAPGPELRRHYFGMHRFEWPEDDSVEFHLGYGDWIGLLTGCGCEVLDLFELQAPAEGKPHGYPALPERWWARRRPSEEIWKARKL